MRYLQAFAFSAVVLAFAVPAQAGGKADGYWHWKDGSIAKSEKTGLCIRSRFWSDSNADRACLEKVKKQHMAMRK